MNEPGAELPPDLGAGPLMDTLQFLRSIASGRVTWPIDDTAPVPAPPVCQTLDELAHWRDEVPFPEFNQCLASASSEKDERACHCAISRKLVAHYAEARYAESSEREGCGTMYNEGLETLKSMESASCSADTAPVPAPPVCQTLEELGHWRDEVPFPEFNQCMASASSEKDERACQCAISRKLA